MSYRLVNSNELAMKYPEVNDMPCIYADLPNGLDNKHYNLSSRHKGRWKQISPAKIYECSECGKNVMTYDICAYGFCHGCGCRMESEE